MSSCMAAMWNGRSVSPMPSARREGRVDRVRRSCMRRGSGRSCCGGFARGRRDPHTRQQCRRRGGTGRSVLVGDRHRRLSRYISVERTCRRPSRPRAGAADARARLGQGHQHRHRRRDHSNIGPARLCGRQGCNVEPDREFVEGAWAKRGHEQRGFARNDPYRRASRVPH